MLSNNIGGSMIINKDIYSGDSQKSGEVGHITLVPHGKPCYCGQHGCVDAYLAATNLSDLTQGNLQAFFDELKAGNTQYQTAWDDYLDHLASTVNIVHVLLDCGIILGGYVGEYLEPYMNDLKERAARLNTFSDGADYLRICSYKKESIAAGAALSFIASFIDSI
jgi:predicted NBD/HSP70 family sugar kinase